MSLTRDSLEVRIAKILLNAQFTVKQKIEREKWKERTLYPTVEKLLAGRPVMGLKAGEIFDVVVEDENHTPRKTKKRA